MCLGVYSLELEPLGIGDGFFVHAFHDDYAYGARIISIGEEIYSDNKKSLMMLNKMIVNNFYVWSS